MVERWSEIPISDSFLTCCLDRSVRSLLNMCLGYPTISTFGDCRAMFPYPPRSFRPLRQGRGRHCAPEDLRRKVGIWRGERRG
ncbi:unnamed protein product [Phaeothamnion confervicola]